MEAWQVSRTWRCVCCLDARVRMQRLVIDGGSEFGLVRDTWSEILLNPGDSCYMAEESLGSRRGIISTSHFHLGGICHTGMGDTA